MRHLAIVLIVSSLLWGCTIATENIHSKRDDFISVGVKKSEWLVLLPAHDLHLESFIYSSDHRFGYFLWKQDPYALSVTIKPATKCPSAISCRDQYLAEIKKAESYSYECKSWENGDAALLQFISKPQGIRLLHVNMHIVRDGFWYDIHFSISGPNDKNESEAIAYIEGIRLVKRQKK